MEYNKKIILFLAFIAMQSNNYSCAVPDWLKTIWPDGAGVKAVQETYKAADQFTTDHLPATGEILKKTSSNLGEKLGSEAAGKFAPAANVFAYAYAASQVWSIGKDVAHGTQSVKSYFWPSKDDKIRAEQQKIHAMKVHQEYELLVAEKTLKDCLLNRANIERAPSGVPCACEGPAQTFAMAAGIQKANDILDVYKQYFARK